MFVYVCVRVSEAMLNEVPKKTVKSKHATKVKENVRANMWEQSIHMCVCVREDE